MKAGAARIDITPEGTTDLSGFFVRTQPAAGIADRIHVRAAVFDNSKTRIVLVSADLLEIPRGLADSLRATLADRLRTHPECVCIACTHTHAAPAVYPLRACGAVCERYTRELGARIVRCAEQAANRLVRVRLSATAGPLRIGVNRRAALREDRGGPTGEEPAEDTLRALSAVDDEGHVRLGLLHYACHPVCQMGDNRLISGDYPGLACAELERRFGDASTFLFFNGCAGDINPRAAYIGGHAGAQRAALELAEAATPLLAERALLSEDVLSAACTSELLACEPPDEARWREQIEALDARIERLRDLRPKGEAAYLLTGRAYYSEWIDRARQGRYPPGMKLVIQRLHVGPMQMVGLSGEVFFELGRQMRAQAARPELWTAGYCNGGEGYIPTRAACREGGYEVDSAHWFYDRPRLVPGEGERLPEAVLRVLGPPPPA